MNLRKIYEDESALVFDKPANLMVHEDGRSSEQTLADIVLAEYPEVETIGDEGRGGIVHRLDKDTTGVIIVAKTVPAFKFFKRQFREHTTRKVYRALVEGKIKDDNGMISAPLARAKSDFRKRTAVDPFSPDSRGVERDALTRYKVITRSKASNGKDYTYVEVYPVTGRTHQIRAHFRSIRHPIIGDELYGSLAGSKEAERSILHAFSLTIQLPEKGEKTFISDIPEDMKKTLERYGISC